MHVDHITGSSLRKITIYRLIGNKAFSVSKQIYHGHDNKKHIKWTTSIHMDSFIQENWIDVTLCKFIVYYQWHIESSCNSLQWRHNGSYGVSNHRRLDCLLNRLFRRRSKNTLKLCVTGLCEGNSPVTGGFPAQMANYAENVSIWWSHPRIL